MYSFTNPLSIIIVSLILSALLLTFFAITFARLKSDDKDYWKNIPDLDNKWIVISFIPLMLALIYSGYVKSLKGFGVEVVIKDTTINIANETLGLKLNEVEHLVGIEVIVRKQATEIGAKEQLDNLKPEKLKSINVLLLKDGVSYEVGAISEYLKRLINLEYIEIIDKNDDFVYLLPLSILDSNDRSITKFTDALKQEQVYQTYPRDTIYESLNLSDSLLTVIEKVSKSNTDHLPVTEKNKLKYIISAKDVINALNNILKESKTYKE
ncbi:MAG: CBS domain-containing protein [Thermodesulfobacteriota bacterium]